MASPIDNSQPLMVAKCDDEHDLPGPATTTGKKGPVITLRRILAALIILFCLLGTAGVIVLGVKIAQGRFLLRLHSPELIKDINMLALWF